MEGLGGRECFRSCSGSKMDFSDIVPPTSMGVWWYNVFVYGGIAQSVEQQNHNLCRLVRFRLPPPIKENEK